MKTSIALGALGLLLAACGGDLDLKIDTDFVDRAAAPIPSGGRLDRTIAVTGDGPVMQGTAEAILTHPAPDDLTVTVRTPAGTAVLLGGRIAEGGDDYRYAVPLLDAQGEAAAGDWRLEIVDGGASGPGELIVWGVDVGGG